MRETSARLQAQLFKKIEAVVPDSEKINKVLLQNELLTEQIADYTKEIDILILKRKGIPSRIKIKDMSEDKRYNKLIEESKKLKIIILMLSYRAETTLYSLLPDFYNNAKKDGRQILKEIFTSCADLIPDYENKILYVRLHSLATPRANDIVEKLGSLLNDTNTCFLMTNLKLVYETVAL